MKNGLIFLLSSVLLCAVIYGAHMPQKKWSSPAGASIDIVIPSYNEQDRIGGMLCAYCSYFTQGNVHFIVVLNGITDNTRAVVQECASSHPGRITVTESGKGKGNAIKHGFQVAVKRKSTYIGFTDADGATPPDQMAKLIDTLYTQSTACGAVIGSRHMKESRVNRAFSFFKDLGRKFFFTRKVRKKLGLDHTDYQCGAKIFRASVIRKITPHITEVGWAIDLDLLYLNKHAGYTAHEVGIVWNDQPGSHLELFSSGKDVCGAISRLQKKKLPTF